MGDIIIFGDDGRFTKEFVEYNRDLLKNIKLKYNEQSNKLLAEYYNKVFNLKPKKNGNSSNTQEGPKAAEIS